jgi:hypothetical protein
MLPFKNGADIWAKQLVRNALIRFISVFFEIALNTAFARCSGIFQSQP